MPPAGRSAFDPDRRPRPRVSVIVPFFNQRTHLGACLDALLSQDAIDGSVEIIAIDNGSTDDGASIVAGYREVLLLREEQAGAYAARNAGVQRASAPLVAFTDADCAVAPDWLRAACERMSDPGIGVTIGACHYPDHASWPLRMFAGYENTKAEYVVSRCAPGYHFAYANNMVVRASLFREIGLFREWSRAADTELVHRLAAKRPDLKLAFDPAMKVTHLEFVRLRDRLRRLSLYRSTNAQIPTFQELGPAQRGEVLLRTLR